MATRWLTTRLLCLLALLALLAGCARGPRAVIRPPAGWSIYGTPTWSGDGQRLVYSIAPTDPKGSGGAKRVKVYIRDLRAGSDTYVCPAVAYFCHPTLTPDGGSLLLVPESPPRIVVAHSLAGGSRTLYQAPHGDRVLSATQSPDGRRLAVTLATAQRRGELADIVVLVEIGGGSRVLWGGQGSSMSFVDWSRDGKLLWQAEVFSRRAERVSSDFGLYVAAAPSWDVVRVPLQVKEFEGSRCAWGPDSRHAVISELLRGRLALDVVDTVTGQTTEIVNEDGWQNTFWIEPEWSPDGRWIAFGKDRADAPPMGVSAMSINLVTPAGGRPRRLVGPTGDRLTGVSWAPDGRSLAFVQRDCVKIVGIP